MATNRELQDFANFLHSDLKPTCINNKEWCIKEQDGSLIKELRLIANNQDDTLVIRQPQRDAYPFANEIETCDFIVFVCKNKEIRIYLCEMKSSLNHIEKAKKQIESSKAFLKHVYESYCVSKRNLNWDLDSIEKYYIYPASNSQKQPTHKQKDSTIPTYNIKIKNLPKQSENGVYNVNIYDFFRF